MDLDRIDATGITHDGTRFRIHGKPANAVAAHKALSDAGMHDRDERIDLLTSIRDHPTQEEK